MIRDPRVDACGPADVRTVFAGDDSCATDLVRALPPGYVEGVLIQR